MIQNLKFVLSFSIYFIFFTLNSFGQSPEVIDESVAFTIIEKAPVFPGCKGINERFNKICLNNSIQKHVASEFNIRKAKNIGLKGMQKIYVQFKIMKSGKIKIMNVRAPHSKLEKEAKRVIKELPKMIPGEHEGRKVNVTYMLPINLTVE